MAQALAQGDCRIDSSTSCAPVRSLFSVSRLWILLLAGAAAIFAAVPVSVHGADAKALRFLHLGRADGLSQAYVNAIAQDQAGFLWFGTQGGLNRYDGYRFKLYAHDPEDPHSLGADLIRALISAPDGALWVATDGGGIAMYDAANDRFDRYQHDPNNAASLSSDQVRTLAVDSDGFIWAGTDQHGLNRLDPATGDVTRFPLAPAIGDLGVYAIAFGSADDAWLGTTAGLMRVTRLSDSNPAVERVALTGTADEPLVRALWLDADGTLWAGTDGQGLYLRDANGSLVHIAADASTALSISHPMVNSIRRVGNGDLWVGTEDGLNLVDIETATVASYGKRVGQEFGLRDAVVQTIFEDEAGLLWLGTFQGASYWDMSTAAMRRYSAKPDVAGELPTNNINSFSEDRNGRVWVATRDMGALLFDKVGQQFRSVSTVFNSAALPARFITTITADSQDRVWLGTRRSGLIKFDVATSELEVFQHSDETQSISGDGVSAILEDTAGQIWVAAFGSGLNRFLPDSGRFVKWVHDPDDSGTLSSNRILTLHEGRSGLIWLGHWRFGVDRLNTRTGRIDRVSVGTALENALVQFLGEDRAGNLWIGTAEAGLYRWSAADQANDRRVFEQFTERHGLASATVYSGAFDLDGNLWLGTSNGLSRLDPNTLTFENYDTSHGLLNTEFTIGAAFAAPDGVMYFGGDNGFNAFVPGEIRGNPHQPKVAITDVRKLGQPLAIAPLVSGDALLELTHRDYLLEFEVTGLDFAAPDKNRYRFRLDGLDEEWLDIRDTRSISYTNLDPGEYTFRAMAANNYGVWSDEEARLSFVVLPAPWATWWAYLAYALSVFVVAAVVFRAHTARLREQAAARHAEELEGMNVELTREVGVRREKERALQQEKQRAETYFNVAEVILLTLDADAKIVRLNNKGCELLGISAAEAVGRSWLDFVPESRHADVVDEMLAPLTSDISAQQKYYELPLVGADDQERLIAWNCGTINFDEPEQALFCSGMDVTRVRALEKQMRLREKMNAIGTLAGGIAHDFNNILQAIYGFTTLALDNLAPDDEKAAYLRQVVKGADRARNLVKRILTFSNQKEYDLQAVDIGPVVTEACALLRGSLPATVEMKVDIGDSRQAVRADPTRVHQIVMNLGTNAAQAMGTEGGRLDVVLAHETLTPDKARRHSRLRPGEYMVLRVKDTGVGMTQETQEHIFDPFFTTKDTSENTGLGLTVVHGIVQSHGGDIYVSSESGRGTVFSVYLPSAQTALQDNSVTEIGAFRGSESIALVDDEEWVLTVTRKILEGQGYRVASFGSGADALAHLEKHVAKIDLLITDETMPRMTGSQLIQGVHRLRPDLPAIIISGKLAPAAVSDSNTWFLQKPFTAMEINEKVRVVLDEVRAQKRRA